MAFSFGCIIVNSSNGEAIKTGKILWQQHTYGYVFPSPVVTRRAVYAADWGTVIGEYNRTEGKVLGGNGSEGPFLSSPTIDRGVLFIGSDDGNIYAFS